MARVFFECFIFERSNKMAITEPYEKGIKFIIKSLFTFFGAKMWEVFLPHSVEYIQLLLILFLPLKK